ncbi:unnamed protein product [Linum tenue]|uniref:Uncharacterized protein n=1 Tax=Linum tenue TaxID=586396 RepID=A0AAV0Q521_9ROSI|nr:unnamed protein product [Linum tenue]
MATAPVKPQLKSLHNFPVSLKWGKTATLAAGGSNITGGRPAPPPLPNDSETDSDPDAFRRQHRRPPPPPAGASMAPHRVGSRSARQQRFSFSSCSSILPKPMPEEQLRKEVVAVSERNKDVESGGEEEIEEDVFILTGSRPSRRPMKRPKNVQKLVDNVFPGLWLVGATVDSYRIPDTPIKR